MTELDREVEMINAGKVLDMDNTVMTTVHPKHSHVPTIMNIFYRHSP
jgi:hypothetical protein